MMVALLFSTRFKKRYRMLPKRLKEKVDERLRLFQNDPHHPTLEEHPLKGEYLGLRSINVTGDWRALYKPLPNAALFARIGTHHELYGT